MKIYRDFPGGTVVRGQAFPAWGKGLIHGQGTKILQGMAEKETNETIH